MSTTFGLSCFVIKYKTMRKVRFYASFLAITVLILPATVSAITLDGISAVPSYPDPTDSRTQSRFIYALLPGETRDDAITIRNDSAEGKTIDINPAKDEGMAGIESWIMTETNQIYLAGGEEQKIPFEIFVPEGAHPGNYSGGITITLASDQNDGLEESIQDNVNIDVTVIANEQPIIKPVSAVPYFIVATVFVLAFFGLAYYIKARRNGH